MPAPVPEQPQPQRHVWIWKADQEAVACGVCGLLRRELPGTDYRCTGPQRATRLPA